MPIPPPAEPEYLSLEGKPLIRDSVFSRLSSADGRYHQTVWVNYDEGLVLDCSSVRNGRCARMELRRGWLALHAQVLVGRSMYFAGQQPLEEEVTKFLKAALAKATKAAKVSQSAGSALSPKHPALSEFLSVEVMDGKPRQTATITICWAQGMLRSFLNDRDSGMSLCVTADSIQGILDALEATLTSDDPAWRPIGGGKAPQKRTRRS